MNQYKLQINDIKKYAREFWGNLFGETDKNTQSYIDLMTQDTQYSHYHICEPLVTANYWADNCSIPKEEFTILELTADNELVKSYTYQEVWDLLPKMRVNYKADLNLVSGMNLNTFLEPLTDIETGKIVCMTNDINFIHMIHCELLNDYLNASNLEETFEFPVYLIDKVNGQPAGVLNKYFKK